jgi:predicted TIM-barrel fold metal-dependent hydrolase
MRIDGHAHLPLDLDEASAWLADRDLAVVNICVDSEELGGLDAQRSWYRNLVRKNPERFAWVTSFSLEGFGQAGWADQVIRNLERDFHDGASACKVWKNCGMELRDADGRYVFVDDERFAKIFAYLQDRRKPLLMHIAEPIACWSPLDPDSPHYGYYSTAKHWHWFGRTDVPAHERLIASRDAIIERYPHLTIIGTHIGSEEHRLPAVGEKLAKWANYRVDTGARLGDLAVAARKDHEATRQWVSQWADRILWGVDWVLTRPLSASNWTTIRTGLERQHDLEWKFFATNEQLLINAKPVKGLNLDRAVLEKLFHRNARTVFWPQC